MTHHMWLSDLYGRIGQLLRENGDAPIGDFKNPSSKHPFPIELIKPLYCNFNPVTLEVEGVKIKCYKPIIEE